MADEKIAVASRVEQLERELSDLRAELDTVRSEARGRQAALEPEAALDARHQSARRRLGRRRNNGSGEDESSGLVSRRRLFGLLGGAAAVGTGFAVAGSTLTADPAGAADGFNMIIGGNSNNNPGVETTLTGSTSGGLAMFSAINSSGSSSVFGLSGAVSGSSPGAVGVQGGSSGAGAGAVGVQGISSGSGTGGMGVLGLANSSTGFAVFANNLNGVGLKTQSLTNAPLLLVDSGVTMPPTTGSWTTGSCVVSGGKLWFCTAGGTGAAANFVLLSAPLVAVNPPARVYDSRNGGGALGNGVTRDVKVTGTFGSSVIPSGISAVLCNLTCANPVGAGFLAMFEAGTIWSGTSNINYNNAQNISNNVTSAVSAPSATSPNSVAVLNGGISTDFVIDVFGYYP